MIVFNLACEHEHSFEGWFGGAEEFDRQLSAGLVECPMCGSKKVRKLLTAPRLNLGASSPATKERPSEGAKERFEEIWMKVARHIARNTEDVGGGFAEEARKIHYAESPARAIRGTASQEQAAALADEGIEVFSFPMPKALKEPLQ